MRRAFAITGLGALLPALIYGQAATSAPAFEVASVKVSNSVDFRSSGDIENGRFWMHNSPMAGIIQYAYHVNFDRIAGPDWLLTQYYDIDATFEPGTDPEAVRLMTQKLLADRFKLSLHHDQTATPVYALVVGKKAPKLRTAVEDARPGCELKGLQLTCRYPKITVAEFAQEIPHWLSQHWLAYPVVDQTGIQGVYDVSLTFTMTNHAEDTVEPPGLSLFDAIEEQLGLKLEQRKAPFDRIVVDHVERVPLPN
jgi:uncharacterized protein (TIGR03435 family)